MTARPNSSPRRAALAVLLAAAAALCAGCLALPDGERLVHWEHSPYQTIVVTDSATRRCLRFGDPREANDQSCRAHGDPERLVFRYTRAMAAVLLLREPAPRRLLLIGVGGGSLPMALTAVDTSMSIDAVDIDPVVLSVAREHFGLRESARLRLHADDGVAWVAAARARGARFDAVLLDAFDADGIPEPLFSPAFLADVRAVLADDGLFIANTHADTPASDREERHARAVFGPLLDLRFADAGGNRVFVAAAAPASLPTRDALLARTGARAGALARLGIEPAWLRESVRFASSGGRAPGSPAD